MSKDPNKPADPAIDPNKPAVDPAKPATDPNKPDPKDPPKDPDEWFVKIKQEEYNEMQEFIKQAKADKLGADRLAKEAEDAKKIAEWQHQQVIDEQKATIVSQQQQIEQSNTRFDNLKQVFNDDINARADALAEQMPEANAQAMRQWLESIEDPVARRWMISTFEALAKEPWRKKPSNWWWIGWTWTWGWDPVPPASDPNELSTKDVNEMTPAELEEYYKWTMKSHNEKYTHTDKPAPVA